ncbi:MAG: rod shape-determining protein [Firmicutes bacterium]|nr:rod shape-determining protein [Bacillota bacterium]
MLFSTNIGIDLGTSSVLVYVKGKGIVLREPSVVAIRKGEMVSIEAVGKAAYDMVGRTPQQLETIFPLEGGVISDYVYCEKMLRYFLEKTVGRLWMRPVVAVCTPCKITEVERMAIIKTCMEVGARSVHLIEEPVAAALGAGIDIDRPSGCMVVDIGGGTTDIAVISMGKAIVSDSIRIAGNNFDRDLIRYMKKKYGLLIGQKTAEQVKIEIGQADHEESKRTMAVKGRHAVSGLPGQKVISGDEVCDAVASSAQTLAEAVRSVLEKTPPELVSDISEHGIMMTGGGSLLRGLDRVIAKTCGIDTFVADDAISAVAIGTGKYVDKLGRFWKCKSR